MTKKIQVLCLALMLLSFLCAPASVLARALNKNDRARIQCAQEKMRIMAEFFDVSLPADKKVYKLPEQCGGAAGKVVQMPKWFASELTRMDKNKVIYVPNEGTYSEVDLWRQAFSNVYYFLIMYNSFRDLFLDHSAN